eukprot:Lankesteria_metandrocarpae@DN1812_c0_g1_i2.p1
MTAEPRSSPGILFLGCGISAAVPQLRHLLNASKCKQNPRPQRELMSQTAAGPWDSTAFLNFKNVILTEDMECRVCLEASQNPLSKNRRNNISLVLCVPGSGTQRSATGADNAAADTEGGGEFQYVLVDIGKTFRESAVRHFLPNRIPRIDALIISHSHEDAAGGLDEVREFQSFEQVQVAEGHMLYRPRRPLPVYLGQACLRDLRKRFSYICGESSDNKPLQQPADATAVTGTSFVGRKVGVLTFCELDDSAESVHVEDKTEENGHAFTIGGIPFVTLPVWHGGEYVTLGFVAGDDERGRVVMLLDVSGIPERIDRFISSLPRVDVLIMDAINVNKKHFAHFNLRQSLKFVEKWQPKKVLFVGTSCDMDYEETNRLLTVWLEECKRHHQKFSVDTVQLAHDGLFQNCWTAPT